MKGKVEEENGLGSRALSKGQNSCPANRGSSTRPASQGMGKKVSGSHLPSSSSLFFVFTVCALQGVRNFLVVPPVSLSQHFSSFSAHCRMDIWLPGSQAEFHLPTPTAKLIEQCLEEKERCNQNSLAFPVEQKEKLKKG